MMISPLLPDTVEVTGMPARVGTMRVMMRTSFRPVRLVAPLVAVVVLIFVLVAPASGAPVTPSPTLSSNPTCDDVVTTAPDVLSDTEVALLTHQAQALAAKDDLVLRVRALLHVPRADTKVYVDNQRARCRSWQEANGSRAPRLLVIVVAVGDHQTGIYYGEGLSSRLDTTANSIQDADMNEHFKQGAMYQGLSSGLTALGAALDRAPVATPHEAARPPHPRSDSHATAVLLWLLALLAGVGLVALVIWSVLHYRAVRSARRASFETITQLRARAGTSLAKAASLRLTLMSGTADATDLAWATESGERLAAATALVDTDLAYLPANMRALKDIEARVLGDYSIDVTTALDALDATVVELSAERAALEAVFVDFPNATQSLRAQLSEGSGSLEAASTLGFNTVAGEAAARSALQAIDAAEQAHKALSKRLYASRVKSATSYVATVRAVAQLPERLEANKARAASLVNDLDELALRVPQSRKLLDGLATQWARDALERYEESLASASTMLDAASRALAGLVFEAPTYDAEASTSALEAVFAQYNQVASSLENVERAPAQLKATLEQATRLAADTEDVLDRLRSHRYAHRTSVPSLSQYQSASTNQLVNPWLMLSLVESSHQDAERAWSSAESARQSEEAAESARQAQQNSTSFGGGASSSWSGGNDGGGSSTSW